MTLEYALLMLVAQEGELNIIEIINLILGALLFLGILGLVVLMARFIAIFIGTGDPSQGISEIVVRALIGIGVMVMMIVLADVAFQGQIDVMAGMRDFLDKLTSLGG